MLTIEKTVLPSPAQWEIMIEGMRNPKNSWDKSDSYATHIEDPETLETADFAYFVGDNDLDLMTRLAKGGPVHAKYRRMIPVFLTINAPFYWWKEFDTYKVGTVCNSCSTMHKIHDKEFTLDDFSHEDLFGFSKEILCTTIEALNDARSAYLLTNDRRWWHAMIQMLPTSYNQKRTIMLNYEVLFNIFHSRRNHKLSEWHILCDWIRTLPLSELITMEDNTDA